MEILALLGASLGLGALSGISLYLTVFTVGLSIDNGWIVLRNGLEPLAALGDPVIWGVAGVLYIVEFFVDKTPWLDSVWDSFHTIIRPVGAVFLAASALGETHASMEILGGLLAGSVAFATHATKAGTRLIINGSPEPFTNIGASVVEDAIVIAGSFFAINHPQWMLVLVILFTAAFVLLAPTVFRAVKAHAIFVKGKLANIIGGDEADSLPASIPHEFDIAIAARLGEKGRVVWAVPCFTGRCPGLAMNLRGYLARASDGRLFFAGKKNFSSVVAEFSAGRAKIETRSSMLYDEVILYNPTSGKLGAWRFSKQHAAWSRLAAENLGGSFEEHLAEAGAQAPAGA